MRIGIHLTCLFAVYAGCSDDGESGTGGAMQGGADTSTAASSASKGAGGGTSLPGCDGWPTQGAVDYLPILPNRRGFGMNSLGGSGRDQGGSRVMRVTTLAESGEGSLAACVAAEGPRTCVFEVSGTITSSVGSLEVRNPYLTIAGQTAPSPGITLRNTNLVVYQTNDVLVQHIRIRVGDDPEGLDPGIRDAGSVTASRGVVFDHVSMSWAIDETFSTWSDAGSTEDVAVVDSIVSEGLNCSTHCDQDGCACHSTGLLIGRNSFGSMITGTLFAHNMGRNPLLRDAFSDVLIANNVSFVDGTEGLDVADNLGSAGPSYGDIINNHLVFQQARLGFPTGITFTADSSFFFADNMCDGEVGPCVNAVAGNDIFLAPGPTLAIDGFVPLPVEKTFDHVLAHAGARPRDRDEVDERVVADVASMTPRIIDSPNDVGGWPELPENKQPYEDPADADGVPSVDPYTGADNPGYTTRELYLHHLARQLECGG
jgi:hypothetical protein